MAKLTEDVTRVFETQPDHNTVSVAAGEKIFKGAFIGCTSNGFGRAYQAGDTVLGIALDPADNTNGADGDIKLDVLARGKVVLELEDLTQANVGTALYITDDNTVTTNEEDGKYFGKIVRIEDDSHAVVAFDFLYMLELTVAFASETEPTTEG